MQASNQFNLPARNLGASALITTISPPAENDHKKNDENGAGWLVELMMAASEWPGFLSAETDAPSGPDDSNWKTSLMVLLGLYPVAMLTLRFITPFLTWLPKHR